MKLLLAIVNNDDSARAAAALTEHGIFVTKLSTTGGFLMVGNTTLLIGTEDDRVGEVKKLLGKYCTTRRQAPAPTEALGRGMKHGSLPSEVTVGGATVFVLNVEETIKI